MTNQSLSNRDLSVLWHPCTQMKDHESFPIIPIKKGQGVWLEDFDGNRAVRVGRFDLLLRMEDRWLLVDYKTGRPDKDVESWIQEQLDRHRPQLNAYTQMAARTLNLHEEKIRWAILFTALPRLVRQEERVP